MAITTKTFGKNKYGPKLATYLTGEGYNRPRLLAPSLTRLHIADAVKSLADPKKVTYQTFETLMALEWSPACDHIDLVLDDSEVDVFPLCIKLLRVLRSEKRTVLEHAYGFMCLQFLAMAVDIAKIAQVDRIDDFQEDVAKLPSDRSIRLLLNNYLRELEGEALFEHATPIPAQIVWLLGWYRDLETGERTCLPKIGGCGFLDVMFLLEQLWYDRKAFMHAAQAASSIFPGWGGLIYMMWNSAVQTHGFSDDPGYETSRAQHKLHWGYMHEISCRYAICCDEREDPLVLIMIDNQGFRNALVSSGTYTSVDVEDSKRVTTTCAQKLNSVSTINNMNHMAGGTVGYSSLMLRPTNFQVQFTELYQAAIHHAWREVSAVHRMDYMRWFNFAAHFGGLIAFMRQLCNDNRKRATNLKAILEIALGEDIFELLAYVLLFPISSLGIKIKTDQIIPKNELPENYINLDFSEGFRKDRDLAKLPPDPTFFPLWFKVSRCIRFNKYVLGVTRQFRAGDLESFWYMMGETWRLRGYLDQSYAMCAYPRCPAPFNVGSVKCGGCFSKYYCGRRCQEADWVYLHEPHMLECDGAKDMRSSDEAE
ncbi:unnamed protein product [Rhizoctonia solani]|uniref:MYND-type domain-containing protein n=1 Tax=Rhizoctonia solani TaxID=456999 RepID=A0A8H3D6E9_9AGAM|nr:unnamed protein product [Rhizoctonia solani]